MAPIYVDRLDEALEERVFSKVRFRDRNRPACLYHYTHKDALEGIVSQNRLWATSASESPKNDNEEILYGCNQFTEQIEHRLKTTMVSEFTVGIMSELKSLTTQRVSKIFLTSFSSLDDDLAMYKTFGGYCLRFQNDSHAGVRMIAPRGLGAGQGFVTEMLPAIYDKEEQNSALLSIIDLLLNTLEDESLIADFEYSGAAPALAKYVAFTISDFALRFITCLKGPGFKREMEWRLVVRPKQLRFSSDTTEADRNCEHFIKPGPPKQHVELAPQQRNLTCARGAIFGLPYGEPNLPIDAVRVGPCEDPEEGATVRRLLNRHDLYSVTILNSHL